MTALAALPLLAVLVLLIAPAGSLSRALAAGLGLVALLALPGLPFALTATAALDACIAGLLTAVPVAYVLLGGIALARLLRAAGAFERLSGALAERLPDPLHRLLALVFGLAVFFESVTGFGVGAVVCAPIFVALGYPPWRAAMLSLLGLCAVPWGALALGTNLGAALSDVPVARLGTLAVPLGLPFWLAVGATALWVARVPAATARQGGWLLAYVAVLAASLVVAVATVSTDLAGAAAGLAVVVLALAAGARRRAPEAVRSIPWRALAPLAVLVVGLAVLRVPGPVADWASQTAVLAWPSRQWRLALPGHPGTWMLIAAAATLALSPAARRRPLGWLADIGRAWLPASGAVAGFLVLASLMSAAGMTGELAAALVASLGEHYAWVIAPVGALGGFITGSNTGSNAMLMPIQLAGAQATDLSREWVAATQNAAGANATLASPGRLVLATRLTGCAGEEARLLRALAPVLLAGALGSACVLVILGGAGG